MRVLLLWTFIRLVTFLSRPYIFPMFEVSYIWIGFYAVLTVVVVGLIISIITGRGRGLCNLVTQCLGAGIAC